MNARTTLIVMVVAAVAWPTAMAADSAGQLSLVKVLCTATSADGEATGPGASASASMTWVTSSGAEAGPGYAHAWAEGSGGSSAGASTDFWRAYCSAGGGACPSDAGADVGVAGGLAGEALSLVGSIGHSPSLGMPVFVGELATSEGSSQVTLAAPGGVLDADALQFLQQGAAADVQCAVPVIYFIGPNLPPAA